MLSEANKKLKTVKEEVSKLEKDLAVLVKEFKVATDAKNAAIAKSDKCNFQLTMA